MNNKDFDFSCKTCTKYVVKLFTRHLIWSLASLGTKSRGIREKFTNTGIMVLPFEVWNDSQMIQAHL